MVEDRFQFAGHTLDIPRHSLKAADREIELRPKSFEVLHYLVENAERVPGLEDRGIASIAGASGGNIVGGDSG